MKKFSVYKTSKHFMILSILFSFFAGTYETSKNYFYANNIAKLNSNISKIDSDTASYKSEIMEITNFAKLIDVMKLKGYTYFPDTH